MSSANKYGAIPQSLSAEALSQVRAAGQVQAANGVTQQATLGNPTAALTPNLKYGSSGSPARGPQLPPPTRGR